MHTNYRRSPPRYRLYKDYQRAWVKRYHHHVYRQRVREALRWDFESCHFPVLDEVWNLWIYD